MHCNRCNTNVPDFLWQGDDHPLLTTSPLTVRVDHSPNEQNLIKVTAEAYVQRVSCQDSFDAQILCPVCGKFADKTIDIINEPKRYVHQTPYGEEVHTTEL